MEQDNIGIKLILVLALPIALCVLALFIALLIKRPRAGLVLMGLLVLSLLLVVGLGYISVARSTDYSAETATVEQEQQARAVIEERTITGSIRPPSVVMIAPVSPATTQASKLWVEDWDAFANQTNWQGFRAESSDTTVTESSARNEALEDAMRDFYRIATQRPEFSGDGNRLRDQLRANLRKGRFIADRYVKKTEKSYGTLWKAYLLVDASPQNVDKIINQYQQVAAVQTTRELSTFASLGALVGVIFLTYLFLNAATKGYFVWRLRTVAVLAVIAASLLALAFVA